jgi:putative membrane protein
MKILPLVRAEFARLTSSRLGKASLAAIMIVPIVYGGLYLWGNEDPYSKLDKIPAALVVADTGATVNDKAVNYGRDAATSLLKDQKFGWKKVSASAAAAGVKDGTYDFAVTFPSEFSTDLASATADTPIAATIELRTDDTNSYLSTTIAKQATEAVRVAVAEKVGKSGSRQLLDAIADIRAGLVKASDGSDTLADGASKAADGASTLASGLSTLDKGAASLPSGTASLSSGAAQVAAGAKTLAGSAPAAASGAKQLATGAKSLATGAKSAASGAKSVSSGAASVASGSAELSAGLKQLDAAYPGVRAYLDATVMDPVRKATLLAQLDALASGTATANSGAANLAAGSSSLSAGAKSLATGTATLSSGASTLSSGASTLSSKLSPLPAGTATLSSGAAQVASGASTLAAKAPALASGIHSASTGAKTLSTGVTKLDTGATKLSTSLDKAVTDVPATTAAQRAAKAAQISDPAAVKQHAVTEAANYGAGLAPFFISLSAWIGLYALFLLVRPLSRRALTAVRRPLRTTLAGWFTPAVLGVVQMVALFAVVTLALHLQVANPLGMVAFMALIAITFAAMILALNVLFGSVGQFLALILMIVQLVTAGGTFPWQTLPAPLAFIHQALPMSHAVDGVRQLMYGGSGSEVVGPVTFLLAWLVGSLAVSFLGALRQGKFRGLRQLRPSAIGG